MNIMVLTDNSYLYSQFLEIIKDRKYSEYNFDFRYSASNVKFQELYLDSKFVSINLKKDWPMVINTYNLVISLHSKQIFPKILVESIRCINIHPGYNPYNRGWFPQVFSILNKKPIGVTIHEMDEFIDHGPVIYQKLLDIYPWETSFDVYVRLIQDEVEIIKDRLIDIIENNYQIAKVDEEGNINIRNNFDALCKIDLTKKVSMEEAINYLRAMTFPGYKNAYFFIDGKKIYVEIKLIHE